MTFSEPVRELPSARLPPPFGPPRRPQRNVGNPLDTDLLRRLERLATSHACELLEAEFRGDRLRLEIDHPEGVTHDLCADISREASALLDAEDFGPASGYLLEVSSPGLDRKLRSTRDYERFAGRRVRATWIAPGTTRRRTVRGQLLGLSPHAPGVALVLEDDSGETLRLAIDSIHQARLLVEL